MKNETRFNKIPYAENELVALWDFENISSQGAKYRF